jgi:hypothetical protein
MVLLINALVVCIIAGVAAYRATDANPRRYSRAGTLLVLSLVDEGRLFGDMEQVIESHAGEVRTRIEPVWPDVAAKALRVHEGMEKSLAETRKKETHKKFKEGTQKTQERVRDRIASQLDPASEEAQVKRIVEQAQQVAEDVLKRRLDERLARSRDAVAYLGVAVPRLASDRWGEDWSREMTRELDEVGQRFLAQHGRAPSLNGKGDPK